MGESKKEYTLIDTDDQEEVKVVFVHRSCCCMSPGCVDDEIRIYEDAEDPSYVMQVPRLMTGYIEGLFDGSMRIKKTEIEFKELMKNVKIIYDDDFAYAKTDDIEKFYLSQEKLELKDWKSNHRETYDFEK